MSVDFTARAIDLLKKATTHDEANEYDDAYKWYMEAIDVFMTAIKYENKNPTKKDMLKKKVKEIMGRAEGLKTYLDSAKNSGSGDGGNGSSTGTKAGGKRDKGKEDDDDKQRMRTGLEGTLVKEKPNVPWSEIAGLEGAKDALKEAVIMPIRFPQLFVGKLKPWRGILIYGPPGTGKSYLAKAVATETDGTFFSVSTADLMSRWLGDSEKLVRNLFEMARETHRESGKPSVIFIDEIDSLCSSRGDGESDASRRIKTEFLVQMQGVGNDNEGILVLAATNIPWGLDSAVRRRFERRIYIPLPDVAARAHMFRLHMGDTPAELADQDFWELAEAADGYSGSDINVVVRNAMMESVRTVQVATHFKRAVGPDPSDPSKTVDTRLVPCSPSDPAAIPLTISQIEDTRLVMPLPVTKMHFYKALRTARPSVNAADIESHIKFTEEFGQEG